MNEIKEAIENEIEWHNEHSGEEPSEGYQKGFIAGLNQALFLVEKMQEIADPAIKSVNKIIDDLEGRSGIGNDWEQIDDDVKTEIKETWSNIIKTIYEDAESHLIAPQA